jgi:hypothetical protein
MTAMIGFAAGVMLQGVCGPCAGTSTLAFSHQSSRFNARAQCLGFIKTSHAANVNPFDGGYVSVPLHARLSVKAVTERAERVHHRVGFDGPLPL